MNKTYCNPMPLPDLPRGMDPQLGGGDTFYGNDYCSISDPDGIYYNGEWCIFTSYGGAYSSKDLINWKRHYIEGLEPKDYCYGPTIVEKGGKFYYTAHGLPLHVADSPFGPYKHVGKFKDMQGNEFTFMDPNFFKDDDGEIYINWCTDIEPGIYGILGAKLDSNDLSQFVTEPKVLIKFNAEHEWEHWGEYNQDANFGWIEGSCMIKIGDRYYLDYASSGTTFSGYASGVYYSDSPLGEFVYQKNNPVISKREGLLRGGGHSCMIKKNDDEIWAFYTCIGTYNHLFERVIGMDRVFVKDGELYCEASDIPHDIDGNARADMLPLTFRSIPAATSYAEGRDPIYAFDDSMLSFWQPAVDDKEPELSISLRGPYIAKAFRIVRRVVGLDYDNGIKPQPLSYKIMIKNLDKEWVTVYDNWDNKDVMMIDYAELESTVGTEAKIVMKNPEGKAREALTSFTVFGEKFIG